jgi:hypothetical protein
VVLTYFKVLAKHPSGGAEEKQVNRITGLWATML